MKKIFLRSTSFFLISLFVFQTFHASALAQGERKLEREPNAAAVSAQKRLALVIGNSRYRSVSELANPVNDATDMSASLQNLGFEVIRGTDASLVEMRRLIREFGEKLERQKGIGLFYYAGHGVEVRGRNFLVPVDADIKREIETEDYSIDVNSILRQMDAANNGFNIVILDACRNNPFARGWNRSGDTGGLANVNAPTGTYIAYAAAPGMTASDGMDTRNGIFTGALLRQLRRPGLKLEEVFKATREEVMTLTNNSQVPWDSSSVMGDFYFSADGSVEGIKNSPISLNDPNSAEVVYWRAIENSTEAADFENYITRSNGGEFKGTFKATAELKLIRLKKAAFAATWVELKGIARNLLKYDYAGIFIEDLAQVRIGNKWGFVDRLGREVIPVKYDDVKSFSNGLAAVQIDYEWGYIDKTGREVIPIKYTYAESFSENFAAVQIDDKWGYVDKTGREIIPIKYDIALPFSNGLASVRIGSADNGKYGYINTTGREVIPLIYDDAGSFSEGLAPVKVGGNGIEGKYKFIDTSGREVIPLKYDGAGSFSDGLAVVSMKGNQGYNLGYIDKSGREVIPLKYSIAMPFSEGMAAVSIGYNWGYINKAGQMITPVKYTSAEPFSDGLAWVQIGDSKYTYIDKMGREMALVEGLQYWSSSFFKKGFLGVISNGKKGFVDIYGNEYFDF